VKGKNEGNKNDKEGQRDYGNVSPIKLEDFDSCPDAQRKANTIPILRFPPLSSLAFSPNIEERVERGSCLLLIH
jgi:hypothetical protein